jgi:integrase
VTKKHPNGSTSRPVYSLGTTDKATARRLLTKLAGDVAGGRDPEGTRPLEDAGRIVRDYAETWLTKRLALGITTVDAERVHFRCHVDPEIGHLPLGDVRPPQIHAILESVASKTYVRGTRQPRAKTYGRETVSKVRGLLHGVFRSAVEDGLVEHNPVTAVRAPRTRETKKERVILTDNEFAQFIASTDVNLELRMMSLVSRIQGGMRASDVNRWDWTMIDRADFVECTILRGKTRTIRPPQRLSTPLALRPLLRAWWQGAGCPESGPVFPLRRGKRLGGFRGHAGGLASRLRHGLFRARVWRMTPIEVPATKAGTRTDRGRKAEGTKLAPNPSDPLYHETATTLPVDFHSFRRAFNTALAEAGVNVQQAMSLASHSDARTHMRYVMKTAAMRTIPEAAIPRLPVQLSGVPIGCAANEAEHPGNVTTGDVSTPRSLYPLQNPQ